MIKIKNALIAAAALATVAVPGIASAGKLGEAFKAKREQLHQQRDAFHDVRDAYKNGEISREEYLAQRDAIRDQVGDIKDTLDEYKASR